MNGDPKRNAEGCLDLTAYEALKNIEISECRDKDDIRFHALLRAIFHLCEVAGFRIEGRIVLKDKHSGRIWR